MRRLFPLPGKRGPEVLGSQSGRVRAEVENPEAISDRPSVAVVAHWASNGSVSRSVCALIDGLRTADFGVVLVSSAESDGPLAWPEKRPDDLTILRRPNLGYDFGSWATALDRYPVLGRTPNVLFINDSLAGPFQPISGLLQCFVESEADVWGLTDTTQFGHHIQSYCLGFKNGALGEAPIARFWRDIRTEKSRDDIIWRYEIGLSRLLHREYYTMDVAFRCGRVVHDGQNPTILGWRRLLDLGFPFVKRQLLRSPEVAPDGDHVREELRHRYGVEVDEWL